MLTALNAVGTLSISLSKFYVIAMLVVSKQPFKNLSTNRQMRKANSIRLRKTEQNTFFWYLVNAATPKTSACGGDYGK